MCIMRQVNTMVIVLRMYRPCCWGLVVALVLSFNGKPTSAKSDHSIWTVDLQHKLPGYTTSYLSVIQSKHLIDILNIPSGVRYLVIQGHSLNEKITLSSDDPFQVNSNATGNHIGLVWSRTRGNDNLTTHNVRFSLLWQDPNIEKIQVLLGISTHGERDLMPGGYNVEPNVTSDTMITPYQEITYDDDIVTVTSKPPSINEIFGNEDHNITTQMYYMDLKEDNDDSRIFAAIRNMMTVNGMLRYGRQVPSGLEPSEYKHMYPLYGGTTIVLGVVWTLNGNRSVSIPTVIYGCNWGKESITLFVELIYAFGAILGAFSLIGGHTFFKIGLGAITLGIVSIVMLVGFTTFDCSTAVKVVSSVFIGIQLLWLFIWWKFRHPLVSIQLTFLLCGSLIASISLNAITEEVPLLRNDKVYWSAFVCIVVGFMFMQKYFDRFFYHILAMTLLGSFMVIIAISSYGGGHLQYIMINTYRRISVKNFGLVVGDIPFQGLDYGLMLVWLVLSGLGTFIQYKHPIGKTPFPSREADYKRMI